MNTQTLDKTTATDSAPVTAHKGKDKSKSVAPVTAQAVVPAPVPAVAIVISERDTLLAKVNAMVADCKGRSPAEQRAILNSAMEHVTGTCPNVTFSENKEQRTAQLNALREKRANLGWQVCARIIGDAVAAIPGAEQVRSFAAQPMANGSLRARETITTTSKAPKGSGKRAVVIR